MPAPDWADERAAKICENMGIVRPKLALQYIAGELRLAHGEGRVEATVEAQAIVKNAFAP